MVKAPNDLGGATDGFHPAADPDWLLSALNRGGGQAFDLLAPDDGFAPPPIPTGFDLDLTGRKAADDFLLFGAGEPEPEPEPTPVDDVIVPGVRVIPGSTVGITIGDIPDLPYPPDGGGGGPLPRKMTTARMLKLMKTQPERSACCPTYLEPSSIHQPN